MTTDVETVIVGAGVVGLAIARALADRGHNVLVIEQYDRVGAETSSRNSEVIHAGLYYTPGSLKARLCVSGKALLYRFAEENGIAFKRCGKLLVATGDAEIPKLNAIAANAAASGVDDLVPMTAASVSKLEPALRCSAAYLSPSTGIIDSHALMVALEGHIQARGGDVVLETRITRLDAIADGYRIILVTGRDDDEAALTCRNLVIAAGLEASELARKLFRKPPAGPAASAYTPPETYFAKGHYFTIAARAPFSRLIYPMPADGGLGVHLTLDFAGAAKFGPDVTWVHDKDYAFEDDDGLRQQTFAREISRWWPDLPADRLQQGYTGLRPKLSRAGEPAADFAIHGPAIHGLDGVVALYGIESPGLTASLAIAEIVAAHFNTRIT